MLEVSSTRRSAWGLESGGDSFWSAAVCESVGGDMWFPETGDSGTAAAAKKICHTCPIEAKCLEYALETDQRYGVWGGMSERDRWKLRTGRPVKNPLPDGFESSGGAL